MGFRDGGGIEQRLDQCLNLKARAYDLSDERAECLAMDHDWHALP